MIKKLSISISLICILSISFAGNMWIETTQQDFADGIYERIRPPIRFEQ
jgi:hypothetical protein